MRRYLGSKRGHTAPRVIVAAFVTLFSATAVSLEFGAGSIFFFVVATASAKDGSDDPGSGSGSGSGESGKSDSGPRGGDDNGGGWHAHISRSGARVDINGDDIRVIYADGFREEIRKGTLILKDPQGRSVVKRRATAADFARLRDL